MYSCHVAWTILVYGDVFLGSLICSWDVGSASVDVGFDRTVSSLVVGRDSSPLCNLAYNVVALSM